MHVQLKVSYEEEPDKYFWLREPPDGSEVDELRQRVASVCSRLPPRAFMMLDAAVAGEKQGALAVLEAIPELSEEIAGVPVRRALAELADTLMAAPSPPPQRRATAEHALNTVDRTKVETAISWARRQSSSPGCQ